MTIFQTLPRIAIGGVLLALAACGQSPSGTGGGYSEAPVRSAVVASASARARAMPMPPPMMSMMSKPLPAAGDRFREVALNTWQPVAEQPVSTFSLDVDTASYAFVRRQLREGRLPPRDAVRVEEMVNYFPYDYPTPTSAAKPFRPTVTITPSPWNPGAQLMHIGLKGWDLPHTQRPRANLTFLIDVSGSMEPPDRLPLIKSTLHQLGQSLRPDDTISIVIYAGQSGVALPPTKGSELKTIFAVVDSLVAAGGTAGGAGIQQAYSLAEQTFDPAAVNRVILATDGDFNVGESDPRRLEELIAAKRKTGIYLTILGVGEGNFNDALMQRLAQAGNGQAAYLDSLAEARKVLIEELGSTMFPIAEDVKIQVEFNPAQVAEYRLIGYETRALARADFNNDKVDAGEVGSGHSITAIYEFRPVGAAGLLNEPLRYKTETAKDQTASQELAFLRLRYKQPHGQASALIEQPVTGRNAVTTLEAAPENVRFAVAVAGFAQMLRKDESMTTQNWDSIAALAESARGRDPYGWRAEFVQMVRLAQSLTR